MFFKREGLEEGRKRYGSKALENQIRKCPKCDAALEEDPATSGPWGTMWTCPTHGIVSSIHIKYENSADPRTNAKTIKNDSANCYVCDGKLTGEVLEVQLGDGWTAEIHKHCEAAFKAQINNTLAKCEQCGKEFDAHSDAERFCSKQCWAEAGRPNSLENADGSRENAGDCDCGHAYSDHDKPDEKGDPLACSKCGCDAFHQVNRKNDAPPLPGAELGYQYTTSTTTETPGMDECKECGHTIGQVFYGICQCGCHTERINAMIANFLENMACPICFKEEGAGLEEHLTTGHGMETQDAMVVARDMETRKNDLKNVNEETVLCHVCGDRERRGVADLTSKGWLCEECQEKFVKELTKDD